MPLLGNDPARRDRPIRTGRRDRPIIQLPSVALRVALVAALAVVLFGVVFFRLWFLQILSGQDFVARANDNRLREVKIVAPRGNIVDRRGEVIVENRPGLAVGLRLMDVPEGRLEDEIVRLARVLKMRPARIRKAIMDHLRPSTMELGDDGEWHSYLTWDAVLEHEITGLDVIIVREDVSERTVSYLKERALSFPGVEVRQNYLRAYPHGTMAAQLLGHLADISAEQLREKHFKGYSAGDVVGVEGLEKTYDRWLRGRDGVARIEVDAFSRPKQSDPVGGRLPEPGHTLVTTLDAKVQEAAERALRTGISLAHRDGKVEANGGAAVVLDARNGDVLAMANYPTYDPGVWVGGISEKKYRRLFVQKGNNYPQLNRAIMETKAVGSTFKVVDAVAGLEEGVISPVEAFFCNGSYKPPVATDKTVFGCWSSAGHGSLSLVDAITQSCDVYFYNVGYRFYAAKGSPLQEWAKRLGMGRPTGIDIEGEAAGRVPTPEWRQKYFRSEVDKLWTPGNSINLSIGQGDLEATPLQLAVTYAAIANGGRVVTPHLGLRIVDAAGQTVRDLHPAKARKVDIAPSTLDLVRQGLYKAANSPTGTSAHVFALYGQPVAGKTGTAEVYDATRSGYVDYAWYASYAPAHDPRYVVVVMIEKGGHGGTVAAPAARVIYDALFHLHSGELTTGSARTD
ncbi:MAG: penicillin-binding protein 2 [Actinobacteria bacterium]|nr:penicillin-binding protein 2 [Actinomycetota bacterium]